MTITRTTLIEKFFYFKNKKKGLEEGWVRFEAEI